MNHWLVKQEPESYPWNTFVADGRATWDGVRNYQARNNLRAMKRGDRVLFYASGEKAKEVVGVARVSRGAFPDPTAEDANGDWVAVEIVPMAGLVEPVPLATLKAAPALKDLPLVRHTRLSVMPVTAAHFATILKLGGGTRKV
jgi:predicted RNA-binding protein with PUA-like domain